MRKLLLALLFVAAAVAARADGLNGPTTIKLAPGLGNSASTANTSTQTVKNNQEIYPQLFYLAVTSSCTINSTCASSATSTAGYLLTATAGSVTFTMPNPGSVGQAPQSFGYDGSHSYTLTTTGGSASIYGCGSSGTSVTLGYSSTLVTDGTNYQCVPSPTPPVGANPTATAGASAVNGSATTFMRSDGAPALPVGSSSQEGILECGSGTTCSGGTISVSGSSTVNYCEAWITGASTIITNGSCGSVSSGTWTTPSWLDSNTSEKIDGCGGGGGGSGIALDGAAGFAGGAGGEFILVGKNIIAASTGYSFAIGAAGTAGTSSPTAGGAGGNTTITISSTTYTGGGGTGGPLVTGSVVYGGTAAGGTATNGTININGQAGFTQNYSASQSSSLGGSSRFGTGGASNTAANAISGTAMNGVAGSGYCSGGSGGVSNSASSEAGGAGTAGVIYIVLSGS